MKSIGYLLIASILTNAESPVRAQEITAEPTKLETLRAQFTELREDVMSAQEKFDARYLDELKKLEEKAQEGANLNLVLAVREEAKQFKTRAPSASKPSPHPELARLQTVYDTQATKIRTEQNAKVSSLVAGYQKQLYDLQAELTKTGDIDGAVAVQAEVRRVELDVPAEKGDPAEPARPPLGTREIVGRYVRIESSVSDQRGGNRVLSLAEVEVFSGKENVAPEGLASQSSTFMGAGPQRAIDGRTDGDYDRGSVTHTNESPEDPWWEVDLGKEILINRIKVWNRTTDPGGTVHQRLKDFSVEILDAEKKRIWRVRHRKTPEPSVEFEVE